ncbi:hypothetical protein IQ238_26680 [Pleurocapsales cyanobacterium LEGE 06147]|nr:hypothetical protein [Pleurocapsales cyanobacterium LEGE 06147]
MNKLSKLLPALALVLGATLAFAFSSPPQGTLKALVNNQWVEISESEPYLCDEAQTSCTARFDEQDQMIPGTEEVGEFIPL